jgi:hypothetical protein
MHNIHLEMLPKKLGKRLISEIICTTGKQKPIVHQVLFLLLTGDISLAYLFVFFTNLINK